MKWLEVKVLFDFEDKSFAADLISDLFYDFGLHGVVVDDTDFDPIDDWADGVPQVAKHDAITGYFFKDDHTERRYKVFEKRLARLEKETGMMTRTLCREIDEEDWAESWKTHFFTQKIGKKIVVKPTWREYSPQQGDIVLEIDPGMAFGTGSHPTTVLCISMIETYLKEKDSFLDVGTGSGILMLAAIRLGAKRVCGIDIDKNAVKIAEKNLLLNGIEPERFSIKAGELVDLKEEGFDVIAANILSDTIVALLEEVKRVLSKEGLFICSGIIEENKNRVVEEMEAQGFEILEVGLKQEWVAIAGMLKEPGPNKIETDFTLHFS